MINKKFKQKYFLFCKDSKFEVKKFAREDNSSYIRRIEIKELKNGR